MFYVTDFIVGSGDSAVHKIDGAMGHTPRT